MSKFVIFILFIILTFPSYKNLLTNKMVSGDDTAAHVIRLIEFDSALNDGHFPVRWSKRVNFGLGYPWTVFNYPLVYYIAESLHKFGPDEATSVRLLLALSFPLSGFWAFLWLRQRFGTLAAILGGITYTIVPYHFVNVFIRGALGEVMAISVVPLSLYCIDRLIKHPNKQNTVFTTLSVAAVLMLHNVVALYFIPIFVIYFLIQFWPKRDTKLLKIFSLCLIWSLAIAAFYLIPAFLYKPLVQLDNLRSDFLAHPVFPTFQDLIYQKWGFGGPKLNFGEGEMSLQIGILNQVFFLVSLIILILGVRKKKNVNFYLALFWIIIFVLCVFMMLSISFPIWKSIEILQYQEFPWRLLSITTASSAFLAAFSYSYFQKKLSKNFRIYLGILLILGLLYLNRNYAKPLNYYNWQDPFKNEDILRGSASYAGEHLPIWHNKTEEIAPYVQGEVIQGNANIKSFDWKTNLHIFQIQVFSDSIIADRTDFFPGWQATANGKKLELIDPKNKLAHGLIAFSLKPGFYTVEVSLKETPEEKVADFITIIGLLLVPIILFLPISTKKLRFLKSIRKF